MAENHDSVLGGEANEVRDVETLNNLEAHRRRYDWRVGGWSGASGVLEPSLS